MNVLVTGVSSGLGKELSISLLAEGCHVWGISRKENSDDAVSGLIANSKFNYTRCDVSKENDVVSLVEYIKQSGYDLDVVILNAAIMEDDFIDGQFCCAKFKEVFEINFFGVLSVVDKVLPMFQNSGRGIFVGISSLSAHRGVVINKIAYPTSKSAINALFEGFRLQLGSPKIRFVTVNFSSLGEKGGVLSASYKYAARKVISTLHGKKNVFDYPFLPSLATRILMLLPDAFISKYIIKTG